MREYKIYTADFNDYSTMSPDDYIFNIIFAGIIAATANYAFNILLIKCISSRQDNWASMLAVIIAGTITYFITRNDNRTALQICTAVVTGSGLYTLYIYWKLMPGLCKIVVLIALCIIPVSVLIYIFVGKRHGKSVIKYILKRAIRSFELSRMLLGLLAAVICIAIPVTYRIHPYGLYRIGSAAELMEAESDANNRLIYQPSQYEVNAVYDDKYRLINNVDRMRILVNEDEWDQATLEKKQDALISLAECQARYWGFPFKLKVYFSEELPFTTKGYYSHSEHLICINNEAVRIESADRCMTSVLHELRHTYQHAMCDAYVKLSPEERNLYAFYGVDEWCKNINDYKNGEDSYYEYRSQILETDARISSESEKREYYEQITEILTKLRYTGNNQE